MFSQDYYNALLISNELKENANAVVRLDEMSITVNDYNSMLVKSKKIVTALNKNGNHHIKTYQVYDPSYQIKKIEAKVYDANGKEIKKYRKRDFNQAAAVTQGQLYQDDKVLFINYTPIAYPYTVEFIVEYVRSSTAFFPPWYPIKGYYVSTQNATYTIKNPKNIDFTSKEYQFEEFNIKKTIINENGISLSANNLKAYQAEQFSASFDRIFPKYTYGLKHFQLIKTPARVTTWEEFGHWQNRSLLKDRTQLPQKTIQEISILTSNITDTIEKVRKIYEFMQQKTRYIGVQIGIGGWQPTSAMEVDRLSYGDCKGLTNYTKALLESQGIESYYTIVHGDNQKIDIDEDFVALQGNHAILTVPIDGKNYFLECTNQYAPFNYTANSTDDRNVLLITPQGGKIARTPKYSAEDSYQTTTGKFKLMSNGNAKGIVSIETGGVQYDERYFLDRATEKEKTDYYKEYWGYLHNLNLKTITHNNDKIQIKYQQDIEFSTTGYASFAGDEMILSLNIFNRNTTLPTRYSNRELPFEIRRGFKDIDDIEIEIPKDYQITFVPEKTILDTKYGSYLCEVQKLGKHKILYKRTFIINEGNYPKEEYELFRNFMRDVIKFDQSKAILTKNK